MHMNIEYHKWWSPKLNQEMELKIYGHFGKPILVFPAQSGRFFDYENFGMVNAVSHLIEAGKIKLYTVDSVDSQSWANFNLHPADRAWRHQDYDGYIIQEVNPFIKTHCRNTDQKIFTTGCSMGAYHSANFFFKHPDIFDGTISLSGLFQLSMFIGDYVDDNVYFNTPLMYLPNLTDPWYLDQYRNSQIVISVGQGAWEDDMIRDTRALKSILEQKNIPAWVDFWGYDVNHDWPWWHKQLPYFLDHLLA